MPEDDGYEIPAEFCQALNTAEQELAHIKGWQEFKSHWKEITEGMNMKPLSEDESMVMVLSSLNEDTIWNIEHVREDPTEAEKKEDYENFKQFLKRLISNALEGHSNMVLA